MKRRQFISTTTLGATGLLLANSVSADGTSNSSGNIYNASTVTDAKSITHLNIGDSVTIIERENAIFDVVEIVDNTSNEMNILELNNDSSKVLKLRDNNFINCKHFGAIGDGIFDDTNLIQCALNCAAGRPVYLPRGHYKITKTLTSPVTNHNGQFASGINLQGEGTLHTILDSHITSGAVIEIGDIDDNLNGATYVHGSEIANLRIQQAVNCQTECGILMRNVSSTHLNNLMIQNICGDGIRLENDANSTAGWNYILMSNIYVESCSGWGINAAAATNYISGARLSLDHITINECGEPGTIPPTSGGFTWKGVILSVTNSSFYKNDNVNIYIGSDSNVPSQVTFDNLTLTDGTIKSFYCTGIKLLEASNIQLSDGNSTTLESFVELDASIKFIGHVSFNNISINAGTVAATFVAFKIFGAHAKLDSCSVNNVIPNAPYVSNGYIITDGFKDKSTLIASKAATQLIYTSESAIIWDTLESDEQDMMYNSTRIALAYKALYNFKGKTTISGLTAGSEVTIALKSTFPDLPQQQCKYVAAGLPSQTFDFDFSGELGHGHSERRYEIMVHTNDTGSRALDVSNPGYNRLTVTRIKP